MYVYVTKQFSVDCFYFMHKFDNNQESFLFCRVCLLPVLLYVQLTKQYMLIGARKFQLQSADCIFAAIHRIVCHLSANLEYLSMSTYTTTQNYSDSV